MKADRFPPAIFILRKEREEGESTFDIFTGKYVDDKYYWVAWLEGRDVAGGPIVSRDNRNEIVFFIKKHYKNLRYIFIDFTDVDVIQG